MSHRYIERLRRISEELDGVRTAITLISKNFDKREIIQGIEASRLSRTFLQEIAKNLDTTYFVRLTAEFEGILKDHLVINHSTNPVSVRGGIWKIDKLLDNVWQKERLRPNQ